MASVQKPSDAGIRMGPFTVSELQVTTEGFHSLRKIDSLVYSSERFWSTRIRNGVLSMLGFQHSIEALFITHKDRLASFGVDLLERILEDYGVKLSILLEDEDKTPQEELVTEMMALIASFSGRAYGLRAAALKTR